MYGYIVNEKCFYVCTVISSMIITQNACHMVHSIGS